MARVCALGVVDVATVVVPDCGTNSCWADVDMAGTSSDEIIIADYA